MLKITKTGANLPTSAHVSQGPRDRAYIDDIYGFISIERGLTEGRPRELRVKLTFYH